MKKLLVDGIFLPDEEDEAAAKSTETPTESTPEETKTDTPEVPAESTPKKKEEPVEAKVEVKVEISEEEEGEEEEGEDEDNKPFLEIIDLSSKLDEAIEAGDTNLIYEIKAKIIEEAANVSDITSKAKKNEKTTSKDNKKLLEEKLNLSKAVENSKPIIDALDSDAKLKDLIILRGDSTKDEEYKTALMAYTQDLLGVDIKSAYLKKQEEERAALAGGGGILAPNTMATTVDNLFID